MAFLMYHERTDDEPAPMTLEQKVEMLIEETAFLKTRVKHLEDENDKMRLLLARYRKSR